jgi:hypothetical protein
MNGMFYAATTFNQLLSDWDVSSVSQMGDMFHGASAFDQTLCWNLKDGVLKDRIFQGSLGGSFGDTAYCSVNR